MYLGHLSLFPPSDITAHASEGQLPVKGLGVCTILQCHQPIIVTIFLWLQTRVISHGSNDWLKKVSTELSALKQRWEHATTNQYA